MKLMTEKFTRKQIEVQLGVRGKEATSAIREILNDGQLAACMTALDPAHSAKRVRLYVFLARTSQMF